MKVLLFIDNLGSGGAQRQIVTIAKHLKTLETDVSLLVYGSACFFLNDLRNDNISIFNCQTSNYISRIFKIRKYIRNGGFDVVVSFLDTPSFLNDFAAIGGKTWTVITSERSGNERAFKNCRKRIFAWFQRYSDTIVCNSDNACKMWLKHYPKYCHKLVTIYNTTILPKISSEYVPKREGKIHIVIVASYQYLKNPIGLIKALALFKENDRNRIHINWYGRIEVTKNNAKAYIEAAELIKEKHLSNILRLNGPEKSIANIMNSADFVALFSEYEGLPNAICEGMRIGKPIIMTRVSDYNNLVDDSNGFLCDWDDPTSIKKAIELAMDMSEEDLIRMGRNSKEKAKFLFSDERIIPQWINLFH